MIQKVKRYFRVSNIIEFLDKYATKEEFINYKNFIIDFVKGEYNKDISNIANSKSMSEFIRLLDEKYNIDLHDIIDSDYTEIEDILEDRDDYYIIHYNMECDGFDIYELNFKEVEKDDNKSACAI